MRELKANEALCLLGKNGMIIILFINHHLSSRISNPAMFPLVLPSIFPFLHPGISFD
jgi:hypothetical protein